MLLSAADVALLRAQGIADPSAIAALTDADFGLRPRPSLGCQAFRPLLLASYLQTCQPPKSECLAR